MNFIKKKLKGHKKDDEEEEYEKAVYEQSLHPQNQDQKNKNTEEWQFFQQLSAKVQDTVQKTQTTLNKLKDTRPEDGSNVDDPFDVDSDLFSRDVPPYGTTKVLRAPPRPPPPSGDKSSMPLDMDFGSDFSQSSIPKGPPRPPPPGSSETFALDSSALHGMPSKGFASPARPPPPNPTKMDHTNIADSYIPRNQPKYPVSNPPVVKNTASLSLLEEFGFHSGPAATTTTNANMQDLLFLDDKEEIDPFDTSFVDVSNITTSQNNKAVDKAPEKSFNPFSSSAKSGDWSMSSPTHSDKGKSAATNPFFSGNLEESKSIIKEENTSFFNPFAVSQPAPVRSNQEDLFGLTLEPSLSTDKVTDDFFQVSEETPKSGFEAGYCNEFVNSGFSMSEADKIDLFDSTVSEDPIVPNTMHRTSIPTNSSIWDTDIKQETVSTAVPRNSIPNDSNMWDTIEKQEPVSNVLSRNSIPNETNLWNSEKEDLSNAVHRKSIPSDANVWDSDEKQNSLLSHKSIPSGENAWDAEEKESTSSEIHQNSITSNINAWNYDNKEEPSSLISDSIGNTNISIKENKIPSLWNDNIKSDILQPETFTTNEEPNKDLNIEAESSMATESLDFYNKNDGGITNESFCDINNTTLEIESQEGILQPEISNVSSDFQRHENENSVMSSDLLSKTENCQLSDLPQSLDSKDLEESATDTIEPTTFAQDFSKPFAEDFSSDKNSFTFKSDPDFDAFAAKFENVKDNQTAEPFDPFMSKRAPNLKKIKDNFKGFESMDEFDPFKVSNKPQSQPIIQRDPSRDSFEDYDNEVDFSVVIKPKVKDAADIKVCTMEPPKLLPPPKTPTKAFETPPASRFNPFDKDFLESGEIVKATENTFETVEADEDAVPALGEAGVRKADSIESPLSPLFDEDTSQPLEIFPLPYGKEGWEMVLRQPNKKKLTGNRFWKKIIVKLSENSVLQLFNKADDKLPFQELPLQACYSLSEIGAQQYDQYGKIFTVKLQYKFYRERVGVRPGQISKVTQGQVTSMGDVAKLGLPLQHSAQTSQLLKMGSQSYKDIQYFILEVEDAIFRMTVHRDRVLTYKTEEVQVIAQDEFYVEQSKTGHVDKQLARVRIFFLAFITGMPSVEVGLNDIVRQGKEVVGRYDIIPVVTEEWIRLEDYEFHSCVIQDEFYKNRVIKFHPPDACLFELLRFRIRPPKNRELPLLYRQKNM